MSRPLLEVADIVRAAGEAFIERSRHWIRWKHVKVLRAIARCRTAALGGHIDECTGCGHRTTISYNSCRDRHCPKCQTAARDRWIEARREELLPTRYIHVVFTLPRHLAPLVLQNKKVLYDLLFRTSAETLLEVARDPKHLGAEIGFFSVLHTWSQKLELHPHVHCVVPAGGLSPDHTHWIRSQGRYFLPKPVLRKVFRGKFVNARGGPMSRWGVAYVLQHHAKKASHKCPSLLNKQISPHVLRHTCAMVVLQATQDIRKVSLWLGHSNLSTTEVYTRADPTEKLEAIEAIVPPHLRRGSFRPPDKLIALLKAKT